MSNNVSCLETEYLRIYFVLSLKVLFFPQIPFSKAVFKLSYSWYVLTTSMDINVVSVHLNNNIALL